MTSTRRQLGRYLGGLGGLVIATRSVEAKAHPYHGTLTQAQHNKKQGTLECSMRVDPDALQAALRHAGSANLDIDKAKPAQLDRLCTSYLRKRVIVCNRVPKRLPLSLVGHELDLKHAWLHFAFPVGKVEDLVGYHFEFRVFFEIAPAQVNRVQLEHGGVRQTLLFRAEHPSELISPPEG
jgi:hypothetical protein